MNRYCSELSSQSIISFQEMLDFSLSQNERLLVLTVSENGQSPDQKEKQIAELNEKAAGKGLKVVWGYEIQTQVGDFLIIPPEVNKESFSPVSVSFEHAINSEFFNDSYLRIWLHPCRGGSRSDWEDAKNYGLDNIMSHIDAIQVTSGKDHLTKPDFNERAFGLAEEYNKAIIGGSDSVQSDTLNLIKTVFDQNIDSDLDLIRQIKQDQTGIEINHEVLELVLEKYALRFAI